MGLFKRKDISNKTLEVYTVITKDKPKNFLTMTLKESEALEYALALIKLDVQDHFNLWCKLRSYDVGAPSSWEEYLANCVTEEQANKYLIKKVTYLYKDVIAMLRLFGNCVPMGCSYDTPLENLVWLQKINSSDLVPPENDTATAKGTVKPAIPGCLDGE